jgi:(1->4)-alpha-D-glucan 1-alpha-D-glucosylmutase
MQKAAREAKLHTSWLDPNLEYEQALDRFVEGLFSDGEFQDELRAFVEEIKLPGFVNGLAFKLLALTSPGVPDCYQGSELWDLSLVDPDNRRPVDYALRQRLLAELDQLSPEQIWARADEGLPKLLLVARSLQLRRRRPECFDGRGDYTALYARGAKAAHVIAFHRGRSVTVVVPRLVLGLEDRWMDTQIALGAGRWRNLFDGTVGLSGTVALAELLGRFPVALLERQD